MHTGATILTAFSEALGSDAAKAVAGQIADTKSVAAFQLGDQLQQGGNTRGLNAANPGETFLPDPARGNTITYLARNPAVGDLPAEVMANGLPGRSNASLVLLHELGHARTKLGAARNYSIELDNLNAVQYENYGRRLQGFPIRLLHDPASARRYGR